MNLYSALKCELKFHLFQSLCPVPVHLLVSMLQWLLLDKTDCSLTVFLLQVSFDSGFLGKMTIFYIIITSLIHFIFSLAPPTQSFPKMILGYFDRAKHSLTLWMLYWNKGSAHCVYTMSKAQSYNSSNIPCAEGGTCGYLVCSGVIYGK